MRRVLLLSLLLSAWATAAQAQVTLKLKHREGTTTTLSTIKAHQVLNIAGMDVETTSEAAVTNKSTVGKPLTDGSVRIDETIESIRFSLSLPGNQKVEYDSSKPGQKSDVAELQSIIDTFDAMKGATYTLVVDAKNRVKAVEGIEKILAAAPEAARSALKGELSGDKVRREAQEKYDLLPDQPLNKGDRWQRQIHTDVGGGQTLKYDAYYEYQGTVEKGGKTLDKIGVFYGAVTYDLDPNSPVPYKVTQSDLKVDSSSGTVLFDREAGEVVENTSATRITGTMTISIMGMDLPTKLDLTLEMGSLLKK